MFYSLTHVSPTESAWSSFALIINKAQFPRFRKPKVANLKSWSLQYLPTENWPKCSCAGARSSAPLMFIFSQKNHSQLLFTSLNRSIAGWLDYVLNHLVAWIWLAGFINGNMRSEMIPGDVNYEYLVVQLDLHLNKWRRHDDSLPSDVRAGPATCNEELDSFFAS